jgi:hypothetical protein
MYSRHSTSYQNNHFFVATFFRSIFCLSNLSFIVVPRFNMDNDNVAPAPSFMEIALGSAIEPMAEDGEVARDPAQDLGAWLGHERFLRFGTCSLCSSAEPHCHCAYLEMKHHYDDQVDIVALCSKYPTPKMLRDTLRWQTEKGMVIVP